MYRKLIIMAALMLPLFVLGQSTVPIRADTVKILKFGGQAVLQTEGKVRATKGMMPGHDTTTLLAKDTGTIVIMGNTGYVWNLNTVYKWDTLSASGGSGSVNLDSLRTDSTVTIVNPSGTSAVIKKASASKAGVMTAADKAVLDSIRANPSSGGGNPAGSVQQIQWKRNTTLFGGDPTFTFDTTAKKVGADDYGINVQPSFSSKDFFMNIYEGKDSVKEKMCIIAPVIDGAGNVTWSFINNSDHEPLGYDSIHNAAPNIEIYYPATTKVYTSSFSPDEQLAKYGVIFGTSVGLNKTIVYCYMPGTWGGSVYWSTASQAWYNNGIGFNGGSGTVGTYDNTTGILTITTTTVQTTGTERDYHKITCTSNRPDMIVRYRDDLSNGTTFKFQITDNTGDLIPDATFDNNTGFNYVGPTYLRQIDLTYMGGSSVWEQAIFNSSSNYWIKQTFKK